MIQNVAISQRYAQRHRRQADFSWGFLVYLFWNSDEASYPVASDVTKLACASKTGTNYIKNGNGDNATSSTANVEVKLWYGIRFVDYFYKIIHAELF